MAKYMSGLHIFRRDLRLEDNTALLKALEECEAVIACFIFDNRQLSTENEYRGDPAVRFLLETLFSLDACLQRRGSQLYCFAGAAEEVLESLIEHNNIESVYWNDDYTPFSRKRDTRLQQVCKEFNIPTTVCHDALLTVPGSVLTQQATPYKVYSSFAKTAREQEVATPHANAYKNFYGGTIKGADKNLLQQYYPGADAAAFVQGGREKALDLLRDIAHLEDYKQQRDIMAASGTSGLSAHNKFGTVSIREVYHRVCDEFSNTHTLVSELYWRDFYYHVAFHFPYVFGKEFNQKYASVRWKYSKKKFTAWCEGKTGFPIVDAGMRQLNTTGWMHNRARMITASFLVKDLHIDWRWGEKYFAQRLVDYDPCVNNGSWQWAASTGCDAQPYFRIFSPWRQIERFDSDCAYIKRWVPELASFTPKEILKLEKGKRPEGMQYPDCIVDHRQAAEEAQDMFNSID